MCSWNIAGARDKLSQENFKKFLRQYDVIWILETKFIKSTEISGFIPYYNRSVHGEHRGGILLLVKNYLKKYIVKVTTNLESQIGLELSIYPKISFGGVYIPPTDSNFYDQSLFANMTAHIENSKNVIVLGDFNARTSDIQPMIECSVADKFLDDCNVLSFFEDDRNPFKRKSEDKSQCVFCWSDNCKKRREKIDNEAVNFVHEDMEVKLCDTYMVENT